MSEVKSVKSEAKGEEEFRVLQKHELKVLQKHELKVLQKQEKEEGKKDSAESGGDCCEPLCNPITCGP